MSDYETPSDKPVAIPARFMRPPTLQEQVRNLVRGEMSRQAAEEGHETFEEADDFDIGDDYDPTSPYEMDFDTENYNGPGHEGSTATEEIPVGKGTPEASGSVQQSGETNTGSASGTPPSAR